MHLEGGRQVRKKYMVKIRGVECKLGIQWETRYYRGIESMECNTRFYKNRVELKFLAISTRRVPLVEKLEAVGG